MEWTKLTTEEQLASIMEESKSHPVLIFKHSSRCNISAAALNRLERNWNTDELAHVKPYFLDLISYRNVSNGVAHYFGVEHESPQMLLVNNGKPVLVRSHLAIDASEIKAQVAIKN